MLELVQPPLVLPKVPVVTHLAHWPTGEVRVCEKHSNQLRGLADTLGFHLHVEELEDETESPCLNCLNELAAEAETHG